MVYDSPAQSVFVVNSRGQATQTIAFNLSSWNFTSVQVVQYDANQNLSADGWFEIDLLNPPVFPWLGPVAVSSSTPIAANSTFQYKILGFSITFITFQKGASSPAGSAVPTAVTSAIVSALSSGPAPGAGSAPGPPASLVGGSPASGPGSTAAPGTLPPAPVSASGPLSLQTSSPSPQRREAHPRCRRRTTAVEETRSYSCHCSAWRSYCMNNDLCFLALWSGERPTLRFGG